MNILAYMIIIIITILNNNHGNHYIEYYQCNNSWYGYINYLTKVVNKIKTYYQKKYLAKRMTDNQYAIIFKLIEDIYYYLKDLFMHNKTIRHIPEHIIEIIYKLICDMTNNTSNTSVFKVVYDFLYQIKIL